MNRKNILSLTGTEAKNFFLKKESYISMLLPSYFDFSELLLKVSNKLENKSLTDFQNKKPDSFENLNYRLLGNKDGRYSWRPIQIIHPAIYVSMVHSITRDDNWGTIQERFKYLKKNSSIECTGIPVIPDKNNSARAEQIINWWEEIEQQSIILWMEYEYLFQTDIVDCYSSIYTHSIAWALHDKEEVKKKLKEHSKTDKNLIGNIIDYSLRSMSYGQTNGIPQWSVLMDFIAEMVLCYSDVLLTQKLQNIDRTEYRILRYRDDYRIFVNSPQIGEEILKNLTEVLIELWMRLNSHKTHNSNHVIRDSIKPDKYHTIVNQKCSNIISEELLIISFLADKFPNSWTVEKRLHKLHKVIQKRTKLSWQNPQVLISILMDIIIKNPRTYPISTAILSKLMSFIKSEDEKNELIWKIRKRFEKIPNTWYLNLWLQRATLKIDADIEYEELLCKKVNTTSIELWNCDWLNNSFKKIINETPVINNNEIDHLDVVIDTSEVNYFAY